ncbi:MAG TPA: energy transducer TonB [Allosphingosinicella sp.]|nr:energy transducer TonB [Allosphingosinicella sp.]
MHKLSFIALAAAFLAGEATACDDMMKAAPARAKANLASLFSDQDYPAEAVAAREQGMVGFTLDVGPDGRAMRCEVTRTSGSPSLDATTCRLLRSRARFTPATDAKGQAVADTIRGRIVWVLPPPPPAPAG